MRITTWKYISALRAPWRIGPKHALLNKESEKALCGVQPHSGYKRYPTEWANDIDGLNKRKRCGKCVYVIKENYSS